MKLLITLGLFISGAALANQSDIDSIEAASSALDSTTLNEVIEQNNGYIKALANYHLSIVNKMNAQPDDAISALSSTINELEKVVSVTPNDDEAWALLSHSYGFMISFKPQLSAEYGQKAMQAIVQAEKLDDTNPRVMLFKGVMSFNTPAVYGGSKSKAMKELNTAISLFESDRGSDNYWGEAEAYVWRGLTHQTLNNNTQAVADFKKALTIKPDLGWAKMLLKNNS